MEKQNETTSEKLNGIVLAIMEQIKEHYPDEPETKAMMQRLSATSTDLNNIRIREAGGGSQTSNE